MMADVSYNSGSDEQNIPKLIIRAIDSIRKIHKKRPEKEDIIHHVQKKHDITLSKATYEFDRMEETGEIFSVNRGEGKLSYFKSDEMQNTETIAELSEHFCNMRMSNSPSTETKHQDEEDSRARRALDFSPTDDFTRWLMNLVESQQGAYTELLQNLYLERDRNVDLSKRLKSYEEQLKTMSGKIEAIQISQENTRARGEKNTASPLTEITEGCPVLKLRQNKTSGHSLGHTSTDQLVDLRSQQHAKFIQHKIELQRNDTERDKQSVKPSGAFIAFDKEPAKVKTSVTTSNADKTQTQSTDSVSIQSHKLPTQSSSQNLRKHSSSNLDRSEVPDNDKNISQKKGDTWNDDITLVVGDSLCGGLDESKLSSRRNIKVRTFPGARVEDFYHYLVPLLKKQPRNLILAIGTNNCPLESAEEITNKISELVSFIKARVPDCCIAFAEIPIRNDNDLAKKTASKVNIVVKRIKDINILKQDNITEICLGKKGLHLNQRGTKTLALNIINYVRNW